MNAPPEPRTPAHPFEAVGAPPEELRALLESLGQPGYRAEQILRWVYKGGANGFEAMSNLPKALRAALAERAVVLTTAVAKVAESRDGTRKLLIVLADGACVESVAIPEGGRCTACISTQVGCALGCVFCASGMGGLERDLSASEIVEQVLHAGRQRPPGTRLTNVVVMGIGEPLMNYDAVVRALRALTAPWGLALSGRRITLSTSGLPARVRQLAAEGLGVNLAVSLHAADDLTRRRLMPHAQAVHEVVAAARDYLHATGREVTLEWVLIRGMNDSAEDAHALAELVGRERMLVNLLPLNEVEGVALEASPAARVERFAAELRRRGVRVKVRRRRGADIAGACGQLRRRQPPG